MFVSRFHRDNQLSLEQKNNNNNTNINGKRPDSTERNIAGETFISRWETQDLKIFPSKIT